MAANLKAMAATTRKTAHTAVQKIIQDHFTSGNAQDAIERTYQMATRYTESVLGGLLGTAIGWKNAAGQRGRMFGL
jgi:hypothetical protein